MTDPAQNMGPMSSRTRKSASDRKKEIVDTALRLAGELGPDRLTAQHLADEIGISQPAVFRHFPTKGAIWQGVAEHIARKMQCQTTSAQLGKLPPEKHLQALVKAQLNFIQTTPAVPAILFSQELHSKNKTLRVFFAQTMAGRHGAFTHLVNREIQAGRFYADLNATDAAYLILALIQGLAMRWSLAGRSFDLIVEGERLLALQLRAFR